MSFRWVLVIVAAFALMLTGCGGDKQGVATPTAKTSEKTAEDETVEEEAPLEQLDVSACADLYSAKLDLMLAGDSAEAQPPADVLSRFSPPAKVQEAIDHFVETGGVQFEDEDYDEMNDRIDNWASAVCPQ